MKKLRVAIIGQGRSGRNIHGAFFKSEANEVAEVVAVVELDPERRARALGEYPGCTVHERYEELYGRKDVDLVVNATYSEMHYGITRELLLNGMNVLVEKPFGRNGYECRDLIKLAAEKNVKLAVFQQTFYAPFYRFAREVAESGKLGELLQVSIRYNNFARRWDWQTLQRKLAGGIYNTGPHPIGIGLGFLDFDKDARVVCSRLGVALTGGDGDDFAKIILEAPDKPLVDIEVTSVDAYSDYNIKLIGTRGTFKCTPSAYKMKYVVDGENVERPVIAESLKDENGMPIYCSEKLIAHEEEGTFDGNAFDRGTRSLYEQLRDYILENEPMEVTAYTAMRITEVIETVHAQNPLPMRF